jgi:hypothetical protein
MDATGVRGRCRLGGACGGTGWVLHYWEEPDRGEARPCACRGFRLRDRKLSVFSVVRVPARRGVRSRERRDHGSRRASGVRSGQDPGGDPDLAGAAPSRPLSANPTPYLKEIRQHELDRRTSRSGSPALVFLLHPKYSRINLALARFIREVGE